jgi:hypothetical protein
MAHPRWRILTAVPQTWQTHLEIAKAIRTLATQYEEEPSRWRAEVESTTNDDDELIKQFVREILQELRKAGYRPDQPRWPAGSGDISGRWSGGAGEGPQAAPKPPSAELPPRSWSIGHNQGPPLDDPPDIPKAKPEDQSEIWDFAKAAAKWLGRAGLRRVLEIGLEATVGGPVGDILLAMEAAYWLSQYLPYIYAYLDPPKTWEELQQNSGAGYDKHHVVERWSENYGIPGAIIYSPQNTVPIPKLKHWEINRWLDLANDDFKDAAGENISPRGYLEGKGWEEHRRIGIEALIKFGVLKP